MNNQTDFDLYLESSVRQNLENPKRGEIIQAVHDKNLDALERLALDSSPNAKDYAAAVRAEVRKLLSIIGENHDELARITRYALKFRQQRNEAHHETDEMRAAYEYAYHDAYSDLISYLAAVLRGEIENADFETDLIDILLELLTEAAE